MQSVCAAAMRQRVQCLSHVSLAVAATLCSACAGGNSSLADLPELPFACTLQSMQVSVMQHVQLSSTDAFYKEGGSSTSFTGGLPLHGATLSRRVAGASGRGTTIRLACLAWPNLPPQKPHFIPLVVFGTLPADKVCSFNLPGWAAGVVECSK